MRTPLLAVFAAVVLSSLSACDRSVSGDVHVDRGVRAYNDKQYEEAVRELTLATQKPLKRHQADEVHTILGNALNELDRLDDARAAHERALELNPKNHKAWVNLGIVHRLSGEFDEAERCYQEAVKLQPDYAELHASLGALYIHRDESDKAISHLEKSIELDEQLAVAHANLSLAYAMVGRFTDAEAQLKRAVVLGYENGPLIRSRIKELKAIATPEGE